MRGGGGRWADNFRESRDFRGGRAERFNNRDRPARGGRFGGGRFNRSFSRSAERSPNRIISPRNDDRRNKEDRRWTEEDTVGKPDLEMDEILKKTRKESMDRSKESIAKKPDW